MTLLSAGEVHLGPETRALKSFFTSRFLYSGLFADVDMPCVLTGEGRDDALRRRGGRCGQRPFGGRLGHGGAGHLRSPHHREHGAGAVGEPDGLPALVSETEHLLVLSVSVLHDPSRKLKELSYFRRCCALASYL